jgi:sarcosine oxidase
MDNSYDVIIVGLGAMGSATAHHVSKQGWRVLGLDRFTPPHEWGSSHGETRVIREAYFEHPSYVPLVQRAYELWAELERESGRELFLPTGGLFIGPPQGEMVSGEIQSATIHNLDYELLSAEALRRRYPIHHPTPEMVAVWEPRAGILYPELCIQSYLELARTQAATLRYAEPVTGWQIDGAEVHVVTNQGRYDARHLVLTAGAWLGQLVPELHLPLTVERQVLFWFKPLGTAGAFHPERCPVFAWEFEPGRILYGFPDLGTGVKVAIHHHQQEVAEPDSIRRTVDASETEMVRQVLARLMPDANGELLKSAVCMYTNTPDLHFLIDYHPAHPQVLIASPCSGHGFKFASAVGEVVADLLIEGQTDTDISLFRLARLRTEG